MYSTGIWPDHADQRVSSVSRSAMKWATLIRLVWPALKIALRVGAGVVGRVAGRV